MLKKNKNREQKSLGNSPNQFAYSLLPSALAGTFMVFILFLEWFFDTSFSAFGLRPRELRGLAGIIFFPFLHANAMHLASNLLPFILLSTLIYNLVKEIFWKVWGFTFLLSGFWTWCFARPGIVIGASGWVYALLGFLLVAGFARMGRKAMVIAGGLAFLYGGMVYGLLPVKSGISWEGHLMGLLAGCLAAWYWRKEIRLNANEPVKEKITEPDDSYPYWMGSSAHFVDGNRNVIHPDDLIWEHGKPRIRTDEEKEEDDNAEKITPESAHSVQQTAKTFRHGPWTWTISG